MAGVPTTDRVQGLFVEALNKEAPAVDADLIDGGLLDSLALVELIFAIEREFGVTIPLEELEIESFRSVASITDFVAGSVERAS
jgi:acyl carrier protein